MTLREQVLKALNHQEMDRDSIGLVRHHTADVGRVADVGLRKSCEEVKKRGFIRILLVTALLVCSRSTVWTAESAPGSKSKTVRLLTVGNSFSQNATRHLERLVTAAGHVLIHHSAAVGGASLQLHWDKAQQFEKDPLSTNGLYSTKRSLKQELLVEPWDFVTIQQASIRSHDIATYRPFARQLFDYIKQNAPKAEVLMHQTWAYRCDDPRFAMKEPKPGEPRTQEEMYQGLTHAYRTIAAELGVRILPVGDAFHLADTDSKWGYQPDLKFDVKGAQAPALPDQTHSLHVGRQWKKMKDGKFALQMDGHHAGMAGEYLGACVFFELMFNENVTGNSFVPAGLDPEYARFLQETAHQAVLKSQAGKTKSMP